MPGPDPIDDIALRAEPWQLQDAHARCLTGQRPANHVHMLAAAVVVVRQDHDVGTLQVGAVLGPPLGGAFRVTRRSNVPFRERVRFLLAFNDKDSLAVAHGLAQLEQFVWHQLRRVGDSLALARSGREPGPFFLVESPPVLAGPFANDLAGLDAPNPDLGIIRVRPTLAKCLVGLAVLHDKRAVRLLEMEAY